jgi:hypothetical protein
LHAKSVIESRVLDTAKHCFKPIPIPDISKLQLPGCPETAPNDYHRPVILAPSGHERLLRPSLRRLETESHGVLPTYGKTAALAALLVWLTAGCLVDGTTDVAKPHVSGGRRDCGIRLTSCA